MARANPLQPAFNAGELGPRMDARVDFERYPLGCRTVENMLLLPQGGAARRPGTRFVAEAKDPGQKPRLMGFEFSTAQAYVLEVGAQYVRFFRNQGQIAVAATDAAIDNGTFETGILGWDDRSTGTASIAHDFVNDRMSLVGAAGAVAWAEQDVTTTATGQEHVLRFRVHGAPGDEIELRVGTTSTGAEIIADKVLTTGYHAVAFTPPASPFYVQFRNTAAKTVAVDDIALIDGAPLEIASPYAESDLFALKKTQSADILYLFHPDHPVHKLERSGHTSWSLTEVAFRDGPWLAQNDTATTLAASATTGPGITITASADVFAAGDVGRLVRLKAGGSWGHAVITGFTDARNVTADVKAAFGSTGATADWRLGAWSATTGYPSVGTFYEQRLVLANTRHQPQTIWFSQTADFENMAPDNGTDGTVEDDDGLDYTISSDQVNAVRWLSPGNELTIGTTGGEWLARSDTTDVPITPTNIQIKRQTTHGSADLAAQRVGDVVLFLQRAGRKIREFAFSFEVDGFRAPDLTLLADHVTRGGIVDMAYQQEPDTVLWCVRADGVLATMTYKRTQNVVAWARQILGGTFAGGPAVAESVAVIPGSAAAGSGERDELWVTVKRTVNGATRRHVEFFEAAFETGEAQADAFYVDSGLTYTGAPTATITGLDHLEGETVAILSDGAVHPARTVKGGMVALDSPAATVHAGLSYTHTLESLRFEAGAAAGTAVGQIKRIHGVTLVLLDSMNAKVGPSVDRLKTIPFRKASDVMDAAVPLFTGERFVEFDGDYATDARLVVRGADPLPFNLLAWAPRLRTHER